MKILLIDNYDSFTFNLYHYISSLKTSVDVIRNDKINDVREYLNDFESLLVDTIKTIFNKDIPFYQTDDHDVCKYCSYKNICNK